MLDYAAAHIQHAKGTNLHELAATSCVSDITGAPGLKGSVRIFVCEALIDFSTAMLAAPCVGQERAARWESRSHFIAST